MYKRQGEVVTFTALELQALQNSQDEQLFTRVLLHSDDGVNWSRENLDALTGSTSAGPGFIQQIDGKVLITLVDAEQRSDRERAEPQRSTAVVRERGHVGAAEVAAVKAAGYDDGQVVEIILHVALNTLTNYVNTIADTPIDFPVVAPRPR